MQEGSSQSKLAQSLAPDLSSSRAGGIFILLSLWKSTGFLAWVSSADSRSGGRNGLQVPVFVRCIDFIKPLLPVLVLEIWGNTIYRASVSTFMACEELLGGFQLQSHWCLRASLWPPPFPLIILVCGWLVVFALLYCASHQPTTARMFLNPCLIYSQHRVQPDDDGKLMGFALMK